jgi:hypothetical protein
MPEWFAAFCHLQMMEPVALLISSGMAVPAVPQGKFSAAARFLKLGTHKKSFSTGVEAVHNVSQQKQLLACSSCLFLGVDLKGFEHKSSQLPG